MFFFLSPLAEVALPLDDYSFIDHLWRDWSPGYDGSWDVARVKESIGDPRAHRGRHRHLPRPLRPLAAGAGAGRASRAAALLPTPKPTLYLHGRDDGCMLLSSIGSPLDFLAEGSEMEIVDGAGHFLHLERPDVVNRRILGFLTGSASPAATCAAGGQAAWPPDHRANPSATSDPATRSARAGSSGQPHAPASPGSDTAPCRSASSSRPRPWRSEPANALWRRAVGPSRHGSARSRPRGARRTGGAAGQRRSRGAPRCRPSRRGRTWPG